MPVRRRGSLLAGFGALLGLWAGAGCQSVPAKQENQTTRPAADGPSRSWSLLRHANPDFKPGQAADPNAKEGPASRPSLSQGSDQVEDSGSATKDGPVAMLRPVVRGVSEAPAETGSDDSWGSPRQESAGPGTRPATAGPGQPGSQSEDNPPVVNTGGQEPAPTSPDSQPATTPIPTEAPWDPPASAPAGTADESPESRVQPIPVRTPPTEKRVTPAVFIGPPKPACPPHPGVPVPKEFAKKAFSSYVIEPPDILLVQGTPAIGLKTQPLAGPHLVRPDGTIGLGIYGSVFVAGMTIDQARASVAALLKQRAAKDLTEEQIQLELQVDVIGYNSKFYYIIADGGGYGQQVYRVPCTGNETVLDAISQIGGLPTVASTKRIWVARATPYDAKNPKVLPVDWKALTQYGIAATNYQLFPGDRIFLHSDPLIVTNSFLNKLLSPVERVLGTVLLGATTVTAVKQAGASTP